MRGKKGNASHLTEEKKEKKPLCLIFQLGMNVVNLRLLDVVHS